MEPIEWLTSGRLQLGWAGKESAAMQATHSWENRKAKDVQSIVIQIGHF